MSHFATMRAKRVKLIFKVGTLIPPIRAKLKNVNVARFARNVVK